MWMSRVPQLGRARGVARRAAVLGEVWFLISYPEGRGESAPWGLATCEGLEPSVKPGRFTSKKLPKNNCSDAYYTTNVRQKINFLATLTKYTRAHELTSYKRSLYYFSALYIYHLLPSGLKWTHANFTFFAASTEWAGRMCP